MHGDAAGLERRPQGLELFVGTGEYGELAGADQGGRLGHDELGDHLGLGLLVGGGVDLDGWPIVACRDCVAELVGRPQHVHAGADDLGGTPAVRREADHLDAGEVVIDVEQQRRVGPVEAVDRLRRVADEEQVVAPGHEVMEQPVLHRVEVLGLVDENVTEPPTHDIGERRIVVELAGQHEEEIVEVDDAAPPFDEFVLGEDRSDLRRRNAASPVLGAGRGDVAGGFDATSCGPGALCGDRFDWVAPGDAGNQAVPVADDVRCRPPLVGPPLAHHAEGDGVERAGLDPLADARRP